MLRNMLALVPAVVLLISIYYLSSQPGEWVEKTVYFTADHNWGHIVAYFALGAAVTWGLLRQGMVYPWRQAFYFTLFCGLADELYQIVVPGRDFEFSDLVLNSIGALAGVLCIRILSYQSNTNYIRLTTKLKKWWI